MEIIARDANGLRWLCLMNHTSGQKIVSGTHGPQIMGDARADGDDWVLPPYGVAIIDQSL